MKEQSKNELARNLKSRHVQLIAIGGTIGTGLFLGAGSSIHLAGPSILLAYIITGLVCFWLMRALGELLLSDLNSTSFVDFVTKYLGEKIGFVTGWTYWICWITIAMAEITAAGMYIRYWFPNVPQWIPGFIILILLIGLNLVTVEAFGETEFWFAIIKIAAILALIAIGFIMVILHTKTNVGQAELTNLVNFGGIFPKGIKGFVLSFQMVLFAFVGIEMVGMTAAETRDPKSVIPKAINEIPVRIGIFYIGALFFLMAIYPWKDISPDSSPFVQVFKNIGIPGAGGIINFVVLTAAASACNSSLFTTGRMLFSLTYRSKSNFGKKLGTLSKSQVPKNAILLSSVVIAVAVVLNILMPNGVFTLISSIATTCFLFIWGTIVLAHLKFKKEQSKKTVGFEMPMFPLSNYVVLIFLALVGVVLLLQKETAIALGGSLVWFVVMFSVAKFRKKEEL
ncbi:amino acid permease [Pediococcus stilesii]|uniref:Gamma-aminobutyrate permease related permease n=1 Tax=Pediococcus stilesii TaxID=331679 RepID=A0A0R2KZ59_9LACO|nr:amino acid permease [Pediococcus stilesii]KRN92917.1 gamma-aminobutyrate permease related permease [Pediococcus stilesii]